MIPNKWKKYQLLSQFGLTSSSYLERAIKRYSKDKLHKVAKYVSTIFLDNITNSKIAIIKFVTLDGYGQLYNLRVSSPTSVVDLKKKIQKITSIDVIEYWVCSVNVEKNKGNFSGRYLIDFTNTLVEVIEIIWWTSPRMLEGNLENKNFPYARLRREDGQLQFKIEQTIISNYENLDTVDVRNCMYAVIELINRQKDKLYAFCETVQSTDLTIVSFEFKFEKGTGRFIDWDTAYDGKVINNVYLNDYK
ncbi:MAG: hypothetical protein WDA22_01495 [Bacteroidota bacterium]